MTDNKKIRLFLKILAVKAKAFEAAAKDPMRYQKAALFKILGRNKKTEFGLKHGFSGIRSVDEYQKSVPLGDGETFRPYIERMARGEANILTVDKPVFFAITSGTTGKPKLVPVTRYSRSRKADVTNLWSYYIAKDHPGILNGKVLAIISHEVEGYTESGIAYGAETGHAYKNLPRAIRDFYALPYQAFEIDDYDARYYCILRIAIEEDVTTIASLNPSTIILLCQRLEKVKEKIIEDVEKGTIDKDLDIPAKIRKKLEKSLKPNPARAGELRSIIRKKGELLPKYFWPGLELIECWKASAARLYTRELPKYFGDVPLRDFGYVSSEARGSIPMSDEGAGGVLAINTNFYEFIPKEDMNKKKKRVLLCDQLQNGKEYFIIVTTPGGLYRYNIDDVIKVSGFFNKTPAIEFVQKGLNAISLTGEKVYESQVNEAVNMAIDKYRLLIKFFTASIQWGDPPCYIFLVEFERDPSKTQKKELLASIEEELYTQNTEYEWTRKKQLLAPPILKVVKKGGFDKYRAKRIREGAPDSQFKVPELTPDMGFQKNFDIEEEIVLD